MNRRRFIGAAMALLALPRAALRSFPLIWRRGVGYRTLYEAMRNARPGDVIKVPPGIYRRINSK